MIHFKKIKLMIMIYLSTMVFGLNLLADDEYVFKAGDPSLQKWLLADTPPYPDGNDPTTDRVKLGKSLFFDPRLSGEGNMSCATCHNPVLGWSDGLPKGKGVRSKVLDRASPTIINTAYNKIQMWDGRKKSLEDQAMGPMEATVEMNMNTAKLFKWLNTNPGYVSMFQKAYPGEKIGAETVSKAIASYERTVVSNNSPFDKWVKGDSKAMTKSQVNGFKLFVGKAECSNCHSEPNFVDDGFHNLGLASWGDKNPDMGRYGQKPIGILKGAFKTPTLRDIERSAPYFHDGSASTLREVVEHYNKGGVVKKGIDPNIKELGLSEQEVSDIVNFMKALSSEPLVVTLPNIPL